MRLVWNAAVSLFQVKYFQCRSVIPKQSGPKYSLKVMKARMKMAGKRVTFEKGEVTYVEIRESSANVEYVSREVQLLWGDEYRILTSDGMVVKDCSGTRGMLIVLLYNRLFMRESNFCKFASEKHFAKKDSHN